MITLEVGHFDAEVENDIRKLYKKKQIVNLIVEHKFDNNKEKDKVKIWFRPPVVNEKRLEAAHLLLNSIFVPMSAKFKQRTRAMHLSNCYEIWDEFTNAIESKCGVIDWAFNHVEENEKEEIVYTRPSFLFKSKFSGNGIKRAMWMKKIIGMKHWTELRR